MIWTLDIVSVSLGIAYALLLAGVMLHIILTKHDNADEAAMWLLAVLLLQGVGVAAYLLFGVNRLKYVWGRVSAIQHRALDAEDEIFGPEAARQRRELLAFVPGSDVCSSRSVRMLDRLFPDCSLFDGNRVEMLTDGTMAYPRMLKDIAAAKSCVRLQSFILMSDRVGKKFLEALEKKAEEGVDVKILFDSFGSFKSYFSPIFRRFLFRRHPNLALRPFSQINIFAPWKFQLRNHRKLLVIDGRIGYTGGINIAEENQRLREVPKSRYIHDLHCRIEGPAVAQLTRSFFLDWAYATRRRPELAALAADFPAPERRGTTRIRVVDSGPGEHYEATQKLFFAAAASAERSLTIVTPYFVPGAGYLNALSMAAARGVEVRIVVPQRNNHWLVDMAARSGYRGLLEHGVRIFEKRGIFSHTKALLVDGEWGFMGSSNCDIRSFRLNFEQNFCFRDGKFPSDLHIQLDRELAESDEVTLFQVEHQRFLRIFTEDLCALLGPIL